MSLSRALTKIIGRLLIGVVLFTQFALASYACPGLAPLATAATAMPPGCEQMDPVAPALCAAHCHQAAQSADTAAAPMVKVGMPTLLYPIPLEPQLSLGDGRSSPAPDARLDAAPEPP
jgi:hypothetical protein